MGEITWKGHLIRLSNPLEQIWAIPADINVLPEYNNDPRTVDNLLDGVNHTCDDLHAWLTPFTSGQDHLIMIDLDEDTSISMIRIWNYNKSRIHSYRGARYVEILLDNLGPIFKGEVSEQSLLWLYVTPISNTTNITFFLGHLDQARNR